MTRRWKWSFALHVLIWMALCLLVLRVQFIASAAYGFAFIGGYSLVVILVLAGAAESWRTWKSGIRWPVWVTMHIGVFGLGTFAVMLMAAVNFPFRL